MSIQAIAYVWGLDLPREEKYLLLAYADHADVFGGSIYPSVKFLARKTGYSKRSIQRITRKLEQRGLLILTGPGPHGVNQYKIPLDYKNDREKLPRGEIISEWQNNGGVKLGHGGKTSGIDDGMESDTEGDIDGGTNGGTNGGMDGDTNGDTNGGTEGGTGIPPWGGKIDSGGCQNKTKGVSPMSSKPPINQTNQPPFNPEGPSFKDGLIPFPRARDKKLPQTILKTSSSFQNSPSTFKSPAHPVSGPDPPGHRRQSPGSFHLVVSSTS